MEPKTNQVDEFFEKLPQEDKEQADIFEEKKTEEVLTPKVEDADDPEKVPESIKDRRHRRLEAKLQAEREANIALTERIKTLSEMDRFSKEVGDEIIPELAKAFDDSELGKENALRFSKVIQNFKQKATEDAIKRIKEEQQKEIEDEKEYENIIDSKLESLEDEHGVDLTSDSPKARKTRREFLELVQELSPKDSNGYVSEYADFDTTFKLYQKTTSETKPQNTRRQDIASRSMQHSNSNTETVRQRTKGFDGWKRDIENGII